MRSFAEILKGVLFRSSAATSGLRSLRVAFHHFSREPHEADFGFLADPRFRNALMLDLGANLGQSALSANKIQRSIQIFSIEANPGCRSGLEMTKRLLGERFRYQLTGVGAATGELEFYVPVRASRMLLEEGTFDPATLASPASVTRLGVNGVDYSVHVQRIPVIAVDSLSLSPQIVKMDLQGFELEALKGMRETIERSRPVFLIEIGETHSDVEKFLRNLGYVERFWNHSGFSNSSPEGGALNAIFLPEKDWVL